jgi:penicillin amidase
MFWLTGLVWWGLAGPEPISLADRARAVLSPIEGRIEIRGLSARVEVLRDRWGVPHIFASNTEDLFFAQGLVAAQDRLYQMEIWRRTGRGELAEALGAEYVERDRFARLVRYRGDMEAEWRSYAPDARTICESFARGVNAWIEYIGDRLPIEFQLLGLRPGLWRAEDCLLRISGLLMTRNASQEMARAELVDRSGLEAAVRYLPPDPPVRIEPDPELSLKGLGPHVLAGWRAAVSVPVFYRDEGSNNWVVNGRRSASGKPLLANDPHRPLLMPSLRYVTHLVAPGWNVIGAGEPAVPGVATGHNERIAWGITINGFDQADLYVERTHPEDPNRYLYRGQWLPMRLERERIAVKGAAAVEVELKYTRHGPVIWEDPAGHRAIALRWAGAEPGTAGYLGSLSLARARNWSEFLAAAERCKLPALNYVYADVEGDIGWIAGGLVPVRRNWTGLLPVSGHSGQYEWEGFLPVRELPQAFNPAAGWLATANHNILPAGYPHRVGYEFAPPYRFQRIAEVLGKPGRFSIPDFEKLQHDETSLPARQLVEWLPDRDAPAVRLLKSWDRVLRKDSAAAALFELWLREIPARWAEAEAPARERDLILRNVSTHTVLGRLGLMPQAARDAILLGALEAAVKRGRELLGPEISAWRWGKLHVAVFRHPLSTDAERRALFDAGPVERGGDAYTPNATGGANFRQQSGASYRHILDLANWDRGLFTNAPGQSGQPMSPHYADLLKLWAEGRYAPLVYSRRAIRENLGRRLVLEPAQR